MDATQQEDADLHKLQQQLTHQVASERQRGVSATKTLNELIDVARQFLVLDAERGKVAAAILTTRMIQSERAKMKLIGP